MNTKYANLHNVYRVIVSYDIHLSTKLIINDYRLYLIFLNVGSSTQFKNYKEFNTI